MAAPPRSSLKMMLKRCGNCRAAAEDEGFASVTDIAKKDMQLLKDLSAKGVTNLAGLEFATKLKN